MRRKAGKWGLFVLIVLILDLTSKSATAENLIAYSLREAERRMQTGDRSCSIPAIPDDDQVLTIGGITRIVGMVYDGNLDDIIIIGRRRSNGNQHTLDDFVVAIRSLFVHDKWPLVSIDKTSETHTTDKQKVRFEGGIENTEFGRTLFEADARLKNMALGNQSASIWGVQSYFDMAVEYAKERAEEQAIQSRFWFYPQATTLIHREHVFAINELRIGVKTELVGGAKGGDEEELHDEIGHRFATSISNQIDELGLYFSEIGKLKALFDLVAIAKGIQSLSSLPDLDYWLHTYPVKSVPTPVEYPLLKKTRDIDVRKRSFSVELDGGIQLKALVLRLNDGDVTALKEAVLLTRPSGDTLTWVVPLEDWTFSGDSGFDADEDPDVVDEVLRKKIGMSVTCGIRQLGGGHAPVGEMMDSLKTMPYSSYATFASEPRMTVKDSFMKQLYSPPGGVMLSDIASVEGGGEEAKVDLSNGNFSIVVEGKNAQLDPLAFRRFITALWSVYYANQDPGISIDPIAPGAKKHLVRYIGNVVNTDLGRVMREADYLLKKWSVGTDRADIPTFMNPDDYAAKTGNVYVGAWSRFWFVPEDMRFRRAENMLLFQDGHMRIKTEYMFQKGESKADPSNEKFATFLTKNYDKLRDKYPVYEELFEYAKLVSLAKYLKDKGVPLHWFLMANKDLVLTEESQGTVDALSKDSDYFRGVYIEGGVDLGAPGQYVIDQEAVNAIREAIDARPIDGRESPRSRLDARKPVSPCLPTSFEVADKGYTLLPQHSMTSGKDRRGVRYQTDLALRGDAFLLTERALGSLCNRLIQKETMKRLKEDLDARGLKPPYPPSKVEILEARARAVAEEKVSSISLNLGHLLNRQYKTRDNFLNSLYTVLGKKNAVELEPLILEHAYNNTMLEVVRYYDARHPSEGEFGEGWHILIPYHLRPFGENTTHFLNLMVPMEITVQNLLSGDEERLIFDSESYTYPGYFPQIPEASEFVGLLFLANGSYRLIDKIGNQFTFDHNGYLGEMILGGQHRMNFKYAPSGFIENFENRPYEVHFPNPDRVKFGTLDVLKEIQLNDIREGTKETFRFSNKWGFGGYVPIHGGKSNIKAATIMNDGSLRFVDRQQNEILFGPDGSFLGYKSSTETFVPVISLSDGSHTVHFRYSLGNDSRPRITQTYYKAPGDSQDSTRTVRYYYDNTGKLVRAKLETKGDARVAEDDLSDQHDAVEKALAYLP